MNVLNSQEQNQSSSVLPGQKSTMTITTGASKTIETNKDLPVEKQDVSASIDKLGFRKNTMTALDRRLQEHGATRDQLSHINSLIVTLLKNAEVKQEDMSDKIELLKKVEITFHELYEKRQVYSQHDASSLKNKEVLLHNKRRGDRTKKMIDAKAKE